MHGPHSGLVRQAFAGLPRDADHHQTGTSAGEALQDAHHVYGELECHVRSPKNGLSNTETRRGYTVVSTKTIMRSCLHLPANGIIPGCGRNENLAPRQEAISACCHEATDESGGKEEILQAIASSQDFLEARRS